MVNLLLVAMIPSVLSLFRRIMYRSKLAMKCKVIE